jgi:dihydrofolate reductase
MAELIYLISASLDGYIADESGNFDWAAPSDDAHGFFNDFQRSIGTTLQGRRMYETMKVWDTRAVDDMPQVSQEFAEAWRDTDKIIYSSTLDTVSEPRTRLERTFDPAAIQTMKDEADRDMAIAGPTLAGEAIRAGLVDRYLLRLAPVIVGGGTSALPPDVRVDLALNATDRFEDGTVMLDYTRR